MQFRAPLLLAAIALTSAVSASSSIESSSSGIVARSAAGVKSHAFAHLEQRASKKSKKEGKQSHVELTRHDIKRIENDLKLLNILKGNKQVTPGLLRPIYLDLKAVTVSASTNLEHVLDSYKTGKRDASFAETTHELLVDLNNVLSKTNKAVKELFENLGESKLYEEIGVPLGHTIGDVLTRIESKVDDLAPELGKIIDPIVAEVTSDLAFLGIHLRSVSEEDDLVSRAANKKSSSHHDKLEVRVQGHLHILTHDLALLEKLSAQGGKVDKKLLSKVLKATFKDAAEATKELTHVINIVHKKADGKKRADGGVEGVFGHLLYRLVHDLVCIIHAVIKLAVNLLGNLGLSEVRELVKDLDDKALEPILGGLKTVSKTLGEKLSPELDPLLLGVHELLVKLHLA
ncbi:hypothetical protein OC845_005841 [Tilletia horrida]|nr:hypothetical protein OC845_005841 [Tilletia horrida]